MDESCVELLSSSDSNSTIILIPSQGKSDNRDIDTFESNDYEPHCLTTLSCAKATTSSNISATSSWQNKFSLDDFYEDSNELPAILTLSQQNENCKDEEPESYTNLLDNFEGCSAESDSDILKKLRYKYGTSTSSTKTKSEDGNSIKDLSFDTLINKYISTVKENEKISSSKEDDNTTEISKGSKRKLAPNAVEKELAKEAKKQEKELKRLKSEQEKAAKNALKLVEKSVKPDECLKYVTVNLENNILNKPYGPVIMGALENSGYNFKFLQQPFSNIIMWTRTVQSVENLEIQSNNQKEKNCLLILESREFLDQVNSDTLVGHIKSLMTFVGAVQLSIALFGLEKYYNYLKSCKRKQFNSEVSGKTTHPVGNEWPKVERSKIEMVLVELQIYCKNCYIRYIETHEELAYFVMECTKAVAQMPYKSMKQQKYEQENEFFGGENKSCVSIDKNGNGLGRLWRQILTQFPLATLEVAEAIASVYSTPISLVLAYHRTASLDEKEKLLQDIPIRRSAGPLTAVRRIGPELSKKIYLFFCSEENTLI